MTADRTDAARELLAFYLEAGVDAVLGEEPIDRLAGDRAAVPVPEPAPSNAEVTAVARPLPSLPPKGSAVRPGPAGPSASPPPSPEAAVMAAREAARSAASLADLRAILTGFEGCALKTMATQLVFADGNPEGRLMFVGEAPGRADDLQALPFLRPPPPRLHPTLA